MRDILVSFKTDLISCLSHIELNLVHGNHSNYQSNKTTFMWKMIPKIVVRVELSENIFYLF